MRAFGYGEAAIAEARASSARFADLADFAVHPSNVAAVRLFQALQTQWRVAPLTTMASADLYITGLDYGVLQPTAQIMGLELTPDDFLRLRIMENEALSAFAAKREARR